MTKKMSLRLCGVPDCPEAHVAKGWCGKHYQRWRRHDDPTTVVSVQYSDTAESFAARTERQDDCLVWTGTKTHDGYGRLRVEGKMASVHRYAWERVHGPIPDGLVIDHKCHVRSCCNVAHLRTVTRKQNMENPSGTRTNNTSGHANVYWHKAKGKWYVAVQHDHKSRRGGHFPPFELHVASFRARLLRNKLFTYNDRDR